MNNVVLIGRLVRDPELRTAGETKVTNVALAVDRKMSKAKKAEFEAAGKPTADFINIVAFGKLAETFEKHLGKGRLIGVQGKIQTGSYEAKDGTKRYTTDVVVSQMDILDWPDKGKEEDDPIEGFEPDDDEIPF